MSALKWLAMEASCTPDELRREFYRQGGEMVLQALRSGGWVIESGRGRIALSPKAERALA